MKPISRFLCTLLSVLLLLAAVGIAGYKLYNVWAGLGAIFITSWVLVLLVNEAMGFGAFFQSRQAPDFKDARFGALDEDDEEEEDEINATLLATAESVTDVELQEALHHFTHLAMMCPDSKNHAERLQDVLEHLQLRLSASTVQPRSAEERSIVH